MFGLFLDGGCVGQGFGETVPVSDDPAFLPHDVLKPGHQGRRVAMGFSAFGQRAGVMGRRWFGCRVSMRPFRRGLSRTGAENQGFRQRVAAHPVGPVQAAGHLVRREKTGDGSGAVRVNADAAHEMVGHGRDPDGTPVGAVALFEDRPDGSRKRVQASPLMVRDVPRIEPNRFALEVNFPEHGLG